MLLHHQFVVTAKKYGSKLAFVDRSVNRKLTYSKALIATLILQENSSSTKKGSSGS